jgi:DNA-directed RNA polymerase specialized sigma24 family protein
VDWDTLDKIARSVALGCDPEDRQDVYQQIFLKFLRYKPRSRKGANIMAYSARTSYFMRETRRDHARLADVYATPSVDTDARLDLIHLIQHYPHEMLSLLRYATRGERRATPRERVQVARLRAKLRVAVPPWRDWLADS